MVESDGCKRSHFGDEVVVDLVLHTPTMHIKKRARKKILKKTIRLSFARSKSKVNTKVEAVAESPNQKKSYSRNKKI
jgi:ATP-binding protein involved in chromosome partitioning